MLIPKQYAKILYELTKDVPADNLDRTLDTFIAYLKKEQAMSKIDFILKAFDHYAKDQEGIAQLTVTTAKGLSDDVRTKLLNQFGEKTEVTEVVDEDLGPGFVIRTDSTILDASVKTQVEKLKMSLKN